MDIMLYMLMMNIYQEKHLMQNYKKIKENKKRKTINRLYMRKNKLKKKAKRKIKRQK